MKGQILAAVVAAAGGKIDPTAREQVERRPLLGNADRMMQRQHGDGRREADPPGARGDIGQHQIGAGQDAQRAEMMLADPCGMKPDLLGVDGFVENIGDKGVGLPGIVFVMVVAQREIAELHYSLRLLRRDR